MKPKTKAALWAIAILVIVLTTVALEWFCRPKSQAQLPNSLSSYLPYDVNEEEIRQKIGTEDVDSVPRQNLLDAHREFAVLAWQAFIALNWPADGDGRPSKTKDISDATSNRVWDFWRPAD